MDKSEWLLIYLSVAMGSEERPSPLNLIHITGGMFLFALESSVPRVEKYRFKLQEYGVRSTEVYDDLDRLVGRGLLEREEKSGGTWPVYKPTRIGQQKGKNLEGQANPMLVGNLRRIKGTVQSMTVGFLLRHMHDKYPTYNSIIDNPTSKP